MKSLLDPTFKYTPSQLTDVGKTFARVIRERKAKEEQERKQERNEKVSTLERRKHGT